MYVCIACPTCNCFPANPIWVGASVPKWYSYQKIKIIMATLIPIRLLNIFSLGPKAFLSKGFRRSRSQVNGLTSCRHYNCFKTEGTTRQLNSFGHPPQLTFLHLLLFWISYVIRSSRGLTTTSLQYFDVAVLLDCVNLRHS